MPTAEVHPTWADLRPITGRKQKALDAAVAELGELTTGILDDIANLEDMDHLFAQVQEQLGRMDVLLIFCSSVKNNPR